MPVEYLLFVPGMWLGKHIKVSISSGGTNAL
jgi:hypothetical protein